MNASVIGCGTLGSGEVVCVATTRKQNLVHVYDGRAWKLAARWNGNEVTAACACGDTVVCAALDDVAYVVRAATVTEVKLPEKSDWIYAAAALSDDTAVLGGQGLFLLSVTDRTVTRRRLSEFNISRPGRDVLRIVRTAGGRTIVLGKKNLLVEYDGDSAVELVDRKSVGRELFFQDAAHLGAELWVAGTAGALPFIARLGGATLAFEQVPLERPGAPVLAALGDELLVGAERLLAGRPGRWRELLPSPLPDDARIVGFTRATAPYPTCALDSDGTSYFTDGHACTRVQVF